MIKSGANLKKMKVCWSIKSQIHKFKTNDQNEKDGQLRGWQLRLIRVKLREIKSLEAIIGVIKKKLEEQGLNQNFQSQIKNPKQHVVQT